MTCGVHGHGSVKFVLMPVGQAAYLLESAFWFELHAVK